MKRTYKGWLSRDASGDLYFGQEKPIDFGGIWQNMGENMQLRESDFPGITYEKSPVKVTMTIDDSVEKYRQKITVDRAFSPTIGCLPCVIGCGKVKGTFVYIVEVEGITTIARQGDVIALKENGEWCVLSKFKE